MEGGLVGQLLLQRDAVRDVGPPVAAVTILVVEDHELVRPAVVRMLEADGYTVLAAADGPEALALSDRHPGTIDVLFTDVLMPGMNGRDLARALLGRRPEMKVIFTSGFAASIISEAEIAESCVAFIQKPYTRDDLFALVRAQLAAPQ